MGRRGLSVSLISAINHTSSRGLCISVMLVYRPVVEAIIGLPKSTNRVITVGARVRGTQTSVRLNISESRTQWGYYFAIISGQELLNRL